MRSKLLAVILVNALVATAGGAGHAQSIRADAPPVDRRQPSDSAGLGAGLQMAGRAVGLVVSTTQVGTGERQRRLREIGSGILVSPCLVLTARHILDPDPPAADHPRTITVTFRTQPVANARDLNILDPVSATVVASGGIPASRRGILLDDWALLRLDRHMGWLQPVRLLDPISNQAFVGRPVALIGFPADRFDRAMPWTDPGCTDLTPLANRILSVDCLGASGDSGGPVLVKAHDGWSLAAMLIRAPDLAADGGVARGKSYAIPIDAHLVAIIAANRVSSRCPAALPA